MPRIIGVAGASGRVGSKTVQLLRQQDVQVVSLSRRPSIDTTITWRYIDYGMLGTLQKAFSGLEVIIFPGSDGDPDEMLQHHRNVLKAAMDCQAKLIYLSALDVNALSSFQYSQVHRQTEELIKASGGDWCIVRASIFTEFFLEAFIEPAIGIRKIFLPHTSGAVSFVSRDDVAAALVYISRLSAREVHLITGSAALTVRDAIEEYCAINQLEVHYNPIPVEQFRHELEEKGVEWFYVDAFAEMFTCSVERGFFSTISSDYQRITGKEPTSFSDVVKERMAKPATDSRIQR